MKTTVLILSTFMLASGATASFGATTCSGDFKNVGGNWVSDPECQRNVAQAIAESQGRMIARHPVSARQETRQDFCNGNEDIATEVYCAPFKD